MIHAQRVMPLNDRPPATGRYVLYWMQQAQRVRFNHALEYSARQANALGLPLVCVFGLTDEFPDANLRHYTFMMQGLAEVGEALAERGIRFAILRQTPDAAALSLAPDAALLVTDRGYLRVQVEWRRRVAEVAPCPVIQVETDVVVPVEVVSDKEEYAARTIRPRIHKHLVEYLEPLAETELAHDSVTIDLHVEDLRPSLATLDGLDIDRAIAPVGTFTGGESEARRLLSEFISDKLADYDSLRNDPSLDFVSQMSPYLHFGQVSALDIALQVIEADSPGEEAFIEELVVRRELSMNFVRYNPDYDTYEAAVPEWARKTLAAHDADAREYLYDVEHLEQADTHDEYWNAAQREMLQTGKMHNYMRMYWGKKILEWTPTAREGFEIALHLNNKYSLDGRDPNSFAGVAWCFGKHDRPWQQRNVLGTVRYMNANGLRRKFDMDAYLRKVER